MGQIENFDEVKTFEISLEIAILVHLHKTNAILGVVDSELHGTIGVDWCVREFFVL